MLFIIAVVLGAILYDLFQKRKSANLPPGPRGLPFIGNLLNLPRNDQPEYQHWLSFKERYGTISSVTVLGTTLVIIHDKEVAHDLLSKHSLKTSSRPTLHFASDLCGFGNFVTFMSHNKTFQHHRKLVHLQLGTKPAVARYRDIQDIETQRLLLRVLREPSNLIKHVKTEAGAIILKMVYGYTIDPQRTDPLVALIERMMHNFSSASLPLHWAVDVLPVIKYLPKSLPGMSFKKTAARWKEINRMVTDVPYTFVRQQMQDGSHKPSFVASLVKDAGQDDEGTCIVSDEEENAIKRAAAAMYAGGSDTTVSSISSFILAMILFPYVQEKAQQEIDLVVGVDRLPQFEDRENLPYVNAVVKESLRWLPVVPLGVVHATDEDLLCRTFHIPRGAYLLPAIWWFLHDPETYAKPDSFDPDRYLEPRNEPDPATEAFGYGRRICPGRLLADESLFLTISRLLAVFKVSKAVDEHGQCIEPKVDVTPGVISRPVNFPYSIQPRNEHAAVMVRSLEGGHPREEGDADLLTRLN